LWLLEELGQPFGHNPAAPHSAEVRAHNPTGKVPALIDGDATVTDSTAILTYLADKHGQFTAPPGTIARAHQDSVTHFVLDEMDAVLWTAARHSFILPSEMRMPAIKDSLKWEYARSLTRLAARLQGPFIMGDQMSLPDIIATHCLGWGLSIKFPEPDALLTAYLARMRARPAYLAAAAR
jgi:glutathione S-transferase